MFDIQAGGRLSARQTAYLSLPCVDEVYQIESLFEALVEAEFDKMIEKTTESKEIAVAGD
ncbi:MAG: hypothetical protein WKF67_02925 [Rubrobacteraceae bacterium]|jgi:hypothetical protein